MDEYTSQHGWPEQRSRFYDLLENDSYETVYSYWPGEKTPRVTRRRVRL